MAVKGTMNNVRLEMLVLGLLALVGGCASSRTPAATRCPPAWTAPLTPEQVTKWLPQEAKAVLLAWAAVQQASKQAGRLAPDIMEFRVEPISNGWDVYIQYVGVYVDGKPTKTPGSFTVVYIDSDWQVTRIVGGA